MSFRNSRRLPLARENSTPPEIKKLKKEQKRDLNKKIAIELIESQDSTRTRANSSVVKAVFDKYEQAFGADMIDRSMVYRLKKQILDGKTSTNRKSEATTGPDSIFVDSNATTVSSLTNGSPEPNSIKTSDGTYSLDQESKNGSGRPKGTTKKAKKDYTTREQEATEKASLLFFQARVDANWPDRMPKGTLLNIIKEVEDEFDLPAGTLRQETVRSRYKQRNASGKGQAHVSPVQTIEGVVVDFCMKLARMGSLLDKEQVISLTNDLLKGTYELERLKEYKKKHTASATIDSVGIKWYENFMN